MLRITCLFLGLLFPIAESLALKQYRCDKVIQYRPCNDDRAIPALQKEDRAPIGIDSGPRGRMKNFVETPTVIAPKYKFDATKQVGVWTGFVQGDGPVTLKLRINSVGTPPEVRYMGQTVLRGRPSPFEFRSYPPGGKRWKWQILALNTEATS